MKVTRDNLFLEGNRGTARNMTIKKRAGEFITSARRGKSLKPPTAAMMAVREKFKFGILYAKEVMKDVAKKALYDAVRTPNQSAYILAVRDSYQAPVIKSITAPEYTGAIGEKITVRAVDDFKVASVKVSVYNADGDLIERGDAVVQQNQVDWDYTTTVVNAPVIGTKIIAVATDMPNNTTTFEETL